MGRVDVDKMLNEITYMQWLHWKVYMQAAPFAEERMDLRFASVVAAIWNVQIAKLTGKNATPKFREIDDVVLRFGDTPEYLPPGPTRPVDGGRGAFSTLVSYLTGGMLPKRD